MKNEQLLHDEIQNEFESLKDFEVGTEEYKATVDGLVKLVDRAIEIDKLNLEAEEKAKNREKDYDFKLQQMEEERKDRLIRNCISTAGIVIPSLLTIWGTLKTLKFEQEGTITTIIGRGFINKLLPKK